MSDRDQMQADAVNRARDMYRRSQSYNMGSLPNGYNGNIRETQSSTHPSNSNQKSTQNQSAKQESGNRTVNPQHEPAQPPTQTAQQPSARSEESSPQAESNPPLAEQNQQNDFLESIFQDKERALIILLIALLGEEGANTSMLLALMYLLM